MSSHADDPARRRAASPAGGRPDLAPIGRRVAAEAIDVAIITVILVGVSVVAGTMLTGAAARGDVSGYLALSGLVGLVFGLLGLAWLLLLSAWHARGGSPGQRALGIALRRRGDGTHLSFGAALGRILVFRLTTIIVVGYFSPLFDGTGQRQGWHDKVVDAVMIDLRAAPAAEETAVPSASVPAEHPAQPVLSGSGILPAVPAVPRGTAGADGLAVPPPLPPLPFPPATVAPPAGVAIPDGLVSEVPGVVRAAPHASAPAGPGPAVDAGGAPDGPAAPAAPPVPPAAPQPSAPAPLSTADDEADVDATRHIAPRRREGVTVVWDDGVAHTVNSAAVFGRNPEAPGGGDLVAVPDTTRSLSKTHFELVVDDGVWIIDRHSTNGTTIESGGARRPAPAGERARLQLGDTVRIGDRSFTLRGMS